MPHEFMTGQGVTSSPVEVFRRAALGCGGLSYERALAWRQCWLRGAGVKTNPCFILSLSNNDESKPLLRCSENRSLKPVPLCRNEQRKTHATTI